MDKHAQLVPDHATEALWYEGGLLTFRATSKQTGGQFVMIELLAPRDMATPLHIHQQEDQVMTVLEGDVDLYIDGQEVAAGAGAVAIWPRGTEHAFCVRSSTARLLFVFTPGTDSEKFYREAGVPAGLRGLPPPMPADRERSERAGKLAHIEVVGPSPF